MYGEGDRKLMKMYSIYCIDCRKCLGHTTYKLESYINFQCEKCRNKELKERENNMNIQKSIDDTCVHDWEPHPEIIINGLALQCKHCKKWEYK